MYAIKLKGVWQLKNKIPTASSWAYNDPYSVNKVAIHTEPPYDFTTQKLGELLVDEINLTSTKEVINFTEEEIKARELADAWSIDPDQLLIQMAIEGIAEQTILDAIKTLPKEMQLPANVKYKRAKNFHRDNPLLNMVWKDLGKSQNELDQFFINASKIK